MMKFPSTDAQVRRLKNLLINGIEERPLLIMWTAASLSQKKIIFFLDQNFPQRRQAITIGYISIRAEEEALAGRDDNSFGHASANHWLLKNPPKPTEGAASGE